MNNKKQISVYQKKKTELVTTAECCIPKET